MFQFYSPKQSGSKMFLQTEKQENRHCGCGARPGPRKSEVELQSTCFQALPHFPASLREVTRAAQRERIPVTQSPRAWPAGFPAFSALTPHHTSLPLASQSARRASDPSPGCCLKGHSSTVIFKYQATLSLRFMSIRTGKPKFRKESG